MERNKIFASLLVAGLIAMVSGNLANILYRPNINARPGYAVEVTQSAPAGEAAAVEPLVNIIELLAKADANHGQELVKKCAICHDFTKDGPNRVGPNLWGIVGNKKAHRSDFTYSKALATKGGTWVYDDLYHMIHRPMEFLPGTKMNFIGFKKPQDVADVIAYLRTLSDNPVPLPTK